MDRYYFIGIGGIGMSALARYFRHLGCAVAGFDRTPTPLTLALQGEGILVHHSDSPALIPPAFREKDTAVIYTPAVGSRNAELQYFINNGNPVLKRSEALGRISSNRELIAVAGTHGKTTTSAIIAHILANGGGGCTAFLGGISKNCSGNLILPPQDAPNCPVVAEADEYDRSFLRLYPSVAVITSMDADHLDIYGSIDALHAAFLQFAGQIRRGGALVVKEPISEHFAAIEGIKIFTYSCADDADFFAKNITSASNGCFNFDLVTPFGEYAGCRLGAAGIINVENAVGAVAAVLAYLSLSAKSGVRGAASAIVNALRSFSGVQRRLDVHISAPRRAYVDDYAHHPAEIAAAIASVRGMFPNRLITGVFQPHLYTRTRDFAEGFAQSLSALDRLILLPIYPAREEPIAGVDSRIIFDRVTIPDKQMCLKSEAADILRAAPPDVLLTLGAGDIDTLVTPLTDMLKNE